MKPTDDYTPENVSGAVPSGLTVLLIFAIVVLIAMAVFFAIKQKPQYPISVIDREHTETATRSVVKVYVNTENEYFYPGDILAPKKNGALILWDTTMPVSQIVGRVNDSGKIEYLPFKILPE